ncbi:hypothetical protein Cme02nite_22900 [Catellatospora methionotrophica]|uniref:Uncharacterized protein n=1 Tax=Catellatospora methionotrophica TaxID=121620 RepID=A0A8J3L426_9ACTN|nr:hypothetical protein [Catellatospora methionotrophica]GIG13958.1 hypothetical protein Cme02nite_22900 [Catellatospora methionotrophica]
MQPIDDLGKTLDAEYAVEADGDHLAVILESRSGRAAGRGERNTDYRAALDLLLRRLKELGAVVEAAVVDSLITQRRQLSEADRALLAAPVRLSDVPDVAALRLRLTNRQKTVGQAPDARHAGNSTKRTRLRLTVPGYGIDDADRLAADLATGLIPQPDVAAQDESAAVDLLAALGVLTEIVEAEKSHVTSATYERAAATVVVLRAEAALVSRYRHSISGSGDHRLRSAVGHTDLYLSREGEIIEAKSGASHRYVRDALGQLLDYAVNVTVPVHRLTALFPAAPAACDIRLLHAYGVDCLHWDGDESFIRHPAPDAVRDAMQHLWRATVMKG